MADLTTLHAEATPDGVVALRTDIAVARPRHRVELVPVARLRPGDSPRLGAVKSSHIDRLAEASDRWPPLLIRGDYTIIDGRYRYLAARQLGLAYVECEYFDGDEGDDFVEAVRRNSEHGLPLTLRERKVAAGRVLKAHPDWSDRRIAELCGLSHGTVGRVRDSETSGGRVTQIDGVRRGKDNRCRPTDADAVRERISQELAVQPDASLREIARRVGSTAETVRSVRKAMASAAGPSQPVVALPPQDAPVLLISDAAFRSTAEGAAFADWFDRANIDDS